VRTELSEDEARFVRYERVARLATVDEDGAPRVVPICPVLDDGTLLFASEPTAKLRHLRRDPRCSVVFDSYVEEWNLNHQVQVRGSARVIGDGREWDRGKRLLDEKYPQYEPLFPIGSGTTLIVAVRIERVTSEGF
jgi:nitroimidazol reductase NimA-like FMN-containing flavoprotein (pyridoxamine 5'-phosphate oxidase superfamily)